MRKRKWQGSSEGKWEEMTKVRGRHFFSSWCEMRKRIWQGLEEDIGSSWGEIRKRIWQGLEEDIWQVLEEDIGSSWGEMRKRKWGRHWLEEDIGWLQQRGNEKKNMTRVRGRHWLQLKKKKNMTRVRGRHWLGEIRKTRVDSPAEGKWEKVEVRGRNEVKKNEYECPRKTGSS